MLASTVDKVAILAYTQTDPESYFYFLGSCILNGQGYHIIDLIKESIHDLSINIEKRRRIIWRISCMKTRREVLR